MTNETFILAVLLASTVVSAEDGDQLLTIDHYVRVKSTVPSIAGQIAQIYVRERDAEPRRQCGSANLADRVVLFVHGAGTPAEVAFDVPYQDYSWMALSGQCRLRRLLDGHDRLRAIDASAGNERSVQSVAGAAEGVRSRVSAAPCAPSYPRNVTTIASDWNDIDAVVDYIRALRHVDRVSLVAWSLGGPRAGGYAARHPEKVNKLVLLAPAYGRMGAAARRDSSR